jgi:hypothetical protein
VSTVNSSPISPSLTPFFSPSGLFFPFFPFGFPNLF